MIRWNNASYTSLATLFLGVAFMPLLSPSAAWSQIKTQRWQKEGIQVGFRNQSPLAANKGLFKPGLWTPVYVTLKKDAKGPLEFPVLKDGFSVGALTIGANDSDGYRGNYRVQFRGLGRAEEQTLAMGFAIPSGEIPEVHCVIDTGLVKRDLIDNPESLPLGHHLYLCVGKRIGALDDALSKMPPLTNNQGVRHSAYVDHADQLPGQWFGYQAVDLMILLTSDKEFLQPLTDPKDNRIVAIADWVRQGGRLVISLSWQNTQGTAALLGHPGWQPALPNVFTGNFSKVTRLVAPANFAAIAPNERIQPFPKDPIQLAELNPGKLGLAVRPEKGGGKLLVRVPYGRGSITFASIELDQAPFTRWSSQKAFWKALITELAPAAESNDPNNQKLNRFQNFGNDGQDLATNLHRELDDFNVPQISFGWVALFIFLFILIVGPVDYLILRLVFKRLEWTWITFPTVVITVTIVSYVTAYSLKGDEQKINRVDLIDIDLRSDLDANFKTKNTYVYGNSWFAVLSPRIQNYTLGVQPNPALWGNDARPASGTMLTWLGRPENTGPAGMGRQNSMSLFRRTYDYAEDATGVKDVPIPVWTTKTFAASWSVKCAAKQPLTVDLSYNPNNRTLNLAGTLKNNLPVDFVNCFLIYDKYYYPLEDMLPANQAKALEIKLDGNRIKKGLRARTDLHQWGQRGDLPIQDDFGHQFDESNDLHFFPQAAVRRFYFFEKTHSGSIEVNHLYRCLDQSWRIRSVRPDDRHVRTAILVARFPRVEGMIGKLGQVAKLSEPALLWQGALPKKGAARPAVPGSLVQETLVRVIIPVRPVK